MGDPPGGEQPQPAGATWNIGDIERLCAVLDLAWQGPRLAGRYGTISAPSRMTIVTVPADRPIKPVYARRLIGLSLPATGQVETGDRRVRLTRLPLAEGGGYLASVAELPGCMSDGITADEARHALQDAMAEWMAQAKAMGWPLPPPRPRLVTA